jgi:glycosyltransferase involved in cell wall biosynthesis
MDGDVAVLKLPALALMSGRFPVPRKGFGALFRLLGESDEIMSQTRFFPLTTVVAYVAAAHGKRIAIVDHGSGHFRFASPILDALSIAYEHAVTLALALVRPRYFGISGASVRWLRHFGIKRAGVLPNGIDPRDAALPVRSADDYRNPTIFFAGRLIPEKGMRELLAGFRLWRERSGREGRLVIAGEGSLEGEIAAAAAADPQVTFLGKITPARVAEELDRAQILVNPSNYPEGLPTLLLEAGRAALPVISTPNGGSGELIDGKETGWLIERGTPDAIANALDEVVERPLEALRRGRNLCDVVAQRHSWPSIVSQYAASPT